MSGILVVTIIIFGCYTLLQASNDSHNFDNPKLLLIPGTVDNFIRFNSSDETSYKKFTSELEEVSNYYEKRDSKLMKCSENSVASNRSCALNWHENDICSKVVQYGYSKARPCIYLKVKKSLNWMPEYIDETNYPENFPETLNNIVHMEHYLNKKAIWLLCEGETPTDAENIGPTFYKFGFGIPSYFFPWKGQEDYLEPIAVVNFERPARGVDISVKCTIWANNLQESVIFKLFVV